jgi:hypothetical protein
MVRLLDDHILNQDTDKDYLDETYRIVNDGTIENMKMVELYNARHALRSLGELADKVVNTLFHREDRRNLLDKFAKSWKITGVRDFSNLKTNIGYSNYPELIRRIANRQNNELCDNKIEQHAPDE